MAYEKTIWKDHIVEKPRTYRQIINEDDGTIQLDPVTGDIIQQGTPVNAKNLNHLEEGVAGVEGRITEQENNFKALQEELPKKRMVCEATIGTGWVGEGPYTQEVEISGILAADLPHVGPVYSPDPETAAAQKEAWGYVDMGIAEDGKITFTCIEGKPETEIPIQIEVMR